MTADQAYALGAQAAQDDPPLTADQVARVDQLLAPHRPTADQAA
jgi:hypothetical protein